MDKPEELIRKLGTWNLRPISGKDEGRIKKRIRKSGFQYNDYK